MTGLQPEAEATTAATGADTSGPEPPANPADAPRDAGQAEQTAGHGEPQRGTREQPEAVEGTDAADASPPRPDAPGSRAPAPRPTPAFRVMDVDDVSLSLPSQHPTVTLTEAEPPLRTLVFPVGLTEGTAMAQALRRMESPRPMTHELFARVLQRARVEVIAVRLVGRRDGNYLAELDLMTPGGRERVDCRPSDALVLVLRMPVPAPVLVDERLLQTGGDVEPLDPSGHGTR